MEHQLPPLPFNKDALTPFISVETMDFHYDKHHRTYVEKLNQMIKGSKYERMPLIEIILNSDGPIFNNAAQIWNHTFFWNCLSDKKDQPIPRHLDVELTEVWGHLNNFKKEFSDLAKSNFGSGWTWLVQNSKNQLEIINTSNAMTPKKMNMKALLTLDVWEHAYYIDYRNKRDDYIDSFWHVLNWEFVASNL
jgi:Fe-Mn family superoxide dismutase